MDVVAELEKMGVNVLSNDRSIIPPLELDIYIPENEFAIEFNGSYWHSEAFLDSRDARKKHIIKTKLANEAGVRVFHLFENIWQNRRKQILSFLRSALGKNENIIYARKCQLVEDLGKDLIENNHIQGHTHNIIKSFNLIHNGDWVGCMTASKHHRQNNSDECVILSRMAFQNNTTVIGGASKMFKHFCEWSRKSGYTKVVSWSDNSWTDGKIYETLGFDLEREYNEDYFYWDMKNNLYVSKQSQKKSITKCPTNMTEHEWALERGLYRIWDCGKKKWVFNL